MAEVHPKRAMVVPILLALAALALAAPVRAEAVPRPDGPAVELARGRVVMPTIGLQLDLTPALAGKPGALWRVFGRAERAGNGAIAHEDVIESRLQGALAGTFTLGVGGSMGCVEAARLDDTAYDQVTSVAGTWDHWHGDRDNGDVWHVWCLVATPDHPTLVARRTWHDRQWNMTGEDDPALAAVSFALHDLRVGPARPRDAKNVTRQGELATPLDVAVLGLTLPAPGDGGVWIARTPDAQTTTLTRALPTLPAIALRIQKSADARVCAADPRRAAPVAGWHSVSRTLVCRPWQGGAVLVELQGEQAAATPLLSALAKAMR